MFEHEPIKRRHIEPVHRGPPIEPLTDIRGDAFLARDGDEVAYKS
jgi:hypothetical protein